MRFVTILLALVALVPFSSFADSTPLKLLFTNIHDDPKTRCPYASFETKVFEDYEPLKRFVMHSISKNKEKMTLRLEVEHKQQTVRTLDFGKGTASNQGVNYPCLGVKGVPGECATIAKGLADTAEYLRGRYDAGTRESKDDQWNGLTCAASLARAFQEYMEDRK
ncbi:MAG: hypothetical protein V1495_01605 [Pseudomonadota bacterium]